MSARDDYPGLFSPDVAEALAAAKAAVDEIDHLRQHSAWLDRIAIERGVELDRLRRDIAGHNLPPGRTARCGGL